MDMILGCVLSLRLKIQCINYKFICMIKCFSCTLNVLSAIIEMVKINYMHDSFSLFFFKIEV